MATATKAPELSATRDRLVTVVVPAAAANDLKRIDKIRASVLGKLGCLGCHSGFDIRWITERDNTFFANAAGEIAAGK